MAGHPPMDHPMSAKATVVKRLFERRLLQIVFIILSILLVYRLLGSADGEIVSQEHPASHLFGNLSLTETQCAAIFPGLTQDIDEAVARGLFKLKWSKTGDLVQGKIQNGKLYLLQWQRKVDLSAQMLYERTATLNQLYRAIVTSPESLPDAFFSLDIRDVPLADSSSYAHRADPDLIKPGKFLMPLFAFWAWPLPFVGSMDRALTAISAIENSLPFRSKAPKAVWRGTHWFNDVQNHELRKRLLKIASGKPWADVETLKWETNSKDAKNALDIEDFCRYKYIIYTEGVSYSGRLPFHQACRSVVLTTPISWMLHTTHLVRPVLSSTLLGPGSDMESKLPDSTRRAWPTTFEPDKANVVFVSPDWSDLEATIQWLEDHPAVAEGIARRQRELFNNRGYLSPAAETCYWRALIKGWNQVAQPEGEEWEENEAVTWETFTLTTL